MSSVQMLPQNSGGSPQIPTTFDQGRVFGPFGFLSIKVADLSPIHSRKQSRHRWYLWIGYGPLPVTVESEG